MIFVKNNVFHLNTVQSSYIFRVTEQGDLEHLYYGGKITFQEDYNAFFQKNSLLLVSTLYPETDVTYGIDKMCFEYSTVGNGDMRDCACYAHTEKITCCFKYKDYSLENPNTENPNPKAHGADAFLTIFLYDEITQTQLQLYYSVFFDCNCIVRSASITAGTEDLILRRLCSLQVDFPYQDLKMVTFNGAWGREQYKEETEIGSGRTSIDVHGGASSARHNPFVMLGEKNADNRIGEVFGFNLIYSGNHTESAEFCPYGNTRFLSGIGFSDFFAKLTPKEIFYTPEAVMTYSESGYNGLSQNMHRFVENHIVPPQWLGRQKPILVNSWEAMYFNITEEKILQLADKAADIGAELLVVDDGWFGKRNNDTTSLGDWFVSSEKFPNGLHPIADKIHEKGLQFGLWFEPEMISVQSELYKVHPDWALGNAKRKPLVLGRNQLVLDLTRKDVQEYLLNTISKCIEDIGIDYIKWDFNRLLSDVQSAYTPVGAVMHAYVLGLYRVLKGLTEKYPNLLFELCASGGNRFDLGMLCFMPVGWVSDNTDVYSRTLIQEGASYAYPLSVMCNHISVCPNHQTKRVTSLESRFSAAAFGVMGLQYDLTLCDSQTLSKLKMCTDRYKEIRSILNGASFYRLSDGFLGNFNSWFLVDKSRKTAYLYVFQKLFSPVQSLPRIKLIGLDPQLQYRILELDLIASGEVFMKNGVLLPQNYQGNETSSDMSAFFDFTAKIYKVECVSK